MPAAKPRLMRIFAGDRVRAIMDKLKMPEGEAIEAGIVTRSIESAQRKVEARNFDIRKQLLEYDDVSNDQRKVIYQQRNAILDAAELQEQITALREGCFSDLVHQYLPPETVEEQWDVAGLEKALAEDWQLLLPLRKTVEAADAITVEDVREQVVQAKLLPLRWRRWVPSSSCNSSASCCCKPSTPTGANT